MTDRKVIPLIPPGKRQCYITGKLRDDKPEEAVRQRWARSLVDEYGYAKADIGIEVVIQMGRARKRCDLAIYRTDALHKQENIYCIVETKRDDVKQSDPKKGDSQLQSYMAASSACRYGLWVGRERMAFVKDDDGTISSIVDIPRHGDSEPCKPTRADLRIAHELKSVFRRCHDYIHANSGLPKDRAFHELLKLIFCKTYEEQEGDDELDFCIHPNEQRSIAGQTKLMKDRLEPLFERVKEAYPYIFQRDEELDIEPQVAAYIVSELQYISVLSCETDVKGDAYETIVGANLRGDRGEHFTPRNVCKMIVDVIFSMFPETDRARLKVMDCCCGTGGLLVSWMNSLRNMIEEQERRRRGRADRTRERLREACSRYIYGLEFNPELVKTAQMNLVMHGDGSVNIFRANTLHRPGEWSDEARQVPYGQFDVVITNPPFGKNLKIDDPHILSQYQLARGRSTVPPEELFVEGALNFVKEGGVMGIVLPDGVLNNPGLKFLRHWLLNHSQLIASIGLPKETFAHNEGVNNPSVIIVRKFTQQEERDAARGVFDLSYDVFMCSPKTCGKDKRGNAIFLRRPDGTLELDEHGRRIENDEIKQVPDVFKSYASRSMTIYD